MRTGGKSTTGFTIVETLIVLAVTSALAGSILVLINGRQNETEFQVASNALKQQLEQIINETSNGYYPSDNDFTCTAAVGGSVTIHAGGAPSVTNSQGTNKQCTFLGKAVEFGIGQTSGDADAAQRFIVYPLVAKRHNNSDQDVSTFAEAGPVALAPSGAPTYPAGVDHSERYSTKNSLSLVHACYQTPSVSCTANKSYAVFALADQLGNYSANPADGSLNSTTQQLDLFNYDLNNVNWPGTPADSQAVAANINKGIDTRDISSLKLCFKSGGTKQSAQLTISGHGQLAVTLDIFENLDCTP